MLSLPLPDPLAGVISALPGEGWLVPGLLLAALVLVLWLWSGARRRAGRLALALEAARGEVNALGRDLALSHERLEQRAARLNEQVQSTQTLADRLADAQEARSRAEALAERRLEAIERLDLAGDDLRADLTAARSEAEAQRTARSALEAARAALIADRDEKLASARRETETLRNLRGEMAQNFRELADASLRQTGTDLQTAHSQTLTALLAPFREHVGRFEEELRQANCAAGRERARLGEQIRMLSERTESIGTEALNLTRALKGDRQKQGAWGEMILERLLEESGLIEGTHFDRQKGGTDEAGARYRPDVTVRLPQGKALVIDAKVSLSAFEAASSAQTDEERQRHLLAHVTALRRHIETLSAKGYDSLTERSVDYVLMFIPIEGALSEAWRVAGDISSYATSRRVGLVTPTTLMLALRTVDHVWTVERRERNAEEIAARAGLLYDKFAGFVEDLERVGKALDQAVRARSDALAKLSTGSGNLVRQAEMLRELGARNRRQLALEGEAGPESAAAE